MMSRPCGCCDPTTALTPLAVENRPGLSAFAYRVGTFANFRETMVRSILRVGRELAAGLSSGPNARRVSGLVDLTTRRSDDYAITFMELWAAVGDVLTFYQERYANDSFLGTATTAEAVARLARLIDYRVRPGVAALAYLKFIAEEGAAFGVPTGLRVQSIAGEGEKPQIYETLEAATVDARLNALRVYPLPDPIRPLRRGATEATLAPGPEALNIREALAAGDRLVLYDETADPVQEIRVDELRVEDDRVVLGWSGPIQSDTWGTAASLTRFARTFRIFGHNQPGRYPTASIDSAGRITWGLKTLQAIDYRFAGGTSLPLDSRYKDIAVGTRLLITAPGVANTLVTVKGSFDRNGGFPPPRVADPASSTPPDFSDTVTILTLDSASPQFDCRSALVYELTGPSVALWDHAYPARVAGTAVYVPARRVDEAKVEIGRTIVGPELRPGVRIVPDEIARGRRVMLDDGKTPPVPATVAAVSFDETVSSITVADLSGPQMLKLDPSATRLVRALVSGPIAFPLSLGPAPQVSVTIGGHGPRTVRLSGVESQVNWPDELAGRLQLGLNAADADAAFAAARVGWLGSRLVIMPGVPDATVLVGATSADGRTVFDLQLGAEQARLASALVSGSFGSDDYVSNLGTTSMFQVPVSVGGEQSNVSLFIQPGSFLFLSSIAVNIEGQIRYGAATSARASARVFAIIDGVDNRLVILADADGPAAQRFLRIDLIPETDLSLETAAATLWGNVLLASHGEAVKNEILGDGDASKKFQRFALKKQPLTYVPNPASGGLESSLRVALNGVRWREVPDLFDEPGTATVYSVRTREDGKSEVRFGDGSTGPVAPTGQGNVVANYRVGSGVVGRVRADVLTTPLDRPVGLDSVTNPLAASGGADPESVEAARRNAPQTVRTFGRVVSLRDFEDLALATGEIAKAHATWAWAQLERVVYLTVAAQQGELLPPTALGRIRGALTALRDPNHRMRVRNYARVAIQFKASILTDPAYDRERVLADARAAALGALAFDAMRLAQPVRLSDLFRVLQDTAGVIAADIDALQFKRPAGMSQATYLQFLRSRAVTFKSGSPEPVQAQLILFGARPDPLHAGEILPSELAWIEAPSYDITLSGMTAL